MTEPQKPTPKEQNLSATPDSKETRHGFFNRIQRVFKPEPAIHPSEADEIVVDMTPIRRTDTDE
jgi:hypothetical protein